MVKIKISIQSWYDGDWVEEYVLVGRGNTSAVARHLLKRYKNLSEENAGETYE